MRAAIVGGKLQGTEAAYLARKAGWETLLIDRAPYVPAAGIADAFRRADVNDLDVAQKVLSGADLIIPALENESALKAVVRTADKLDLPVACDLEAYRVSSSKKASNRLFDSLGLARPRDWPDCRPPLVVKPNNASGSRGVRVVHDEKELARVLAQNPDALVQAFAHGPSFSIEVVGCQGTALPLVVTDLHLDPGFDCKRVTAPTGLPPRLADELASASANLARALDLTGIMDLEVIQSQDGLQLLEIDARLPSQTPTAVYWSAGLNMVEMLGRIFVHGRLPEITPPGQGRFVIYEHIQKKGGRLDIAGEHIMSMAGPLKVLEGWFGSTEALTDYQPGQDNWRATMIYCGDSQAEVWAIRDESLAGLVRHFSLNTVCDWGPENRE